MNIIKILQNHAKTLGRSLYLRWLGLWPRKILSYVFDFVLVLPLKLIMIILISLSQNFFKPLVPILKIFWAALEILQVMIGSFLFGRFAVYQMIEAVGYSFVGTVGEMLSAFTFSIISAGSRYEAEYKIKSIHNPKNPMEGEMNKIGAYVNVLVLLTFLNFFPFFYFSLGTIVFTTLIVGTILAYSQNILENGKEMSNIIRWLGMITSFCLALIVITIWWNSDSNLDPGEARLQGFSKYVKTEQGTKAFTKAVNDDDAYKEKVYDGKTLTAEINNLVNLGIFAAETNSDSVWAQEIRSSIADIPDKEKVVIEYIREKEYGPNTIDLLASRIVKHYQAEEIKNYNNTIPTITLFFLALVYFFWQGKFPQRKKQTSTNQSPKQEITDIFVGG